ncbi:rhomboid family intramembrane serine protease [Corynebacterium sp. NPDC060344]|uniref:rhomboid family intramembrane serine protease n=1 Tax=Corynebacterium sp. NPDC060344 TaxID=3347101 RepID=UPI003653399D
MQPGARGRRPDPDAWGPGYGAPVPARRRTTALAPRTADGGIGSALGAGIGFTVLTWVAFFVNQIFFFGPDNLNQRFGLRPLDPQGLWGILFAPFLHADMQHLMANTVPAALFAALIAFTSKKLWLQVTAVVMVVSGAATWFIGGIGTAHVGASGLVYGWLAFLIVRGFYNRAPGQILLGMILGFGYSGLIWGVFPTEIGVSWQMHLFGAIGGILAASMLKRGRAGR